MRVLITTDTVGGVWTFTHELAAGLLQCGCPVTMVSFGREPSAAQVEQSAELSRDYAGRFRCIPTDIPLEWMKNNERVFEEGARVLYREMQRFSPDLIHSSQFCFGAIRSHVPHIITAHSDVLSWARACRATALPESDWMRKYVSMVQAGLLACDALVAPTEWMLHALKTSFTIPGEGFVIPNGRDIAADFEGVREVRAVTAGRLWDEAKDVRLLESVRSPMPIVVAGDAREDRQALSGAIADAHFAGQLSEPEMIDLLQSSSVYLCLSRYEPFGLAPLEAALCGCAVVARDIGSLREVWGESAIFFKTGEDLSNILLRLNEDHAYLRFARERSYRRAQRYTRESMVSEYLNLYRRLLEQSARAQHVA